MDRSLKNIVLISGPSGVGKGTVIQYVLDHLDGIELTVSATTRPPRAGEVHGENYYFLSNQAFDQAIESGEFAEWCWVHQNRYGTLFSEVKSRSEKAKYVLVELDVYGTMKLKEVIPEVSTIFIMPPSKEILIERLTKRNTESKEVIDRRIEQAEEEMTLAPQYDFTIINHEIENTGQKIIELIKAK